MAGNLDLSYLTGGGYLDRRATVDSSLRRLDALVQMAVVSATVTAQPGSPSEGQIYILGATHTGAAWAAMAQHDLAYYHDSAWEKISPKEGWTAWIKDTDLFVYFTGSAWAQFPIGKIATVSATDRVLGRVSSGAGAAEEITFTDQAQQLCDDTSFSAMLTTLGALPLAGGTMSGNISFSDNLEGVNLSSGGRLCDRASSEATLLFCAGNVLRVLNEDGNTQLFLLNSTGPKWGNAEQPLYHAAEHALPAADNTYDLGSGSFRMRVLYAGTGTINTSDAREKTELAPLLSAEVRAIRRVLDGIGAYQWLAAIAAKGDDHARLHIGVTAQDVEAAFRAEGLDPYRYALFCADPLIEEVEITETAEERTPVTREVWAYAIDHIEGAAVQRPILRQEPVKEIVPVLDAAGDPVLDAAGAAMTLTRAIEDVRTVTRSRRETRPVLDAQGQPVLRLGVRYDQLFALALAALARAAAP